MVDFANFDLQFHSRTANSIKIQAVCVS